MADDTATMSWINAAYKLGVTAVIAMGLVWFLTQDVKNGLIEMRIAHAAMAVDLKTQNIANEAILRELAKILRTLTAMCVNASGNDAVARASCVQ